MEGIAGLQQAGCHGLDVRDESRQAIGLIAFTIPARGLTRVPLIDDNNIDRDALPLLETFFNHLNQFLWNQ